MRDDLFFKFFNFELSYPKQERKDKKCFILPNERGYIEDIFHFDFYILNFPKPAVGVEPRPSSSECFVFTDSLLRGRLRLSLIYANVLQRTGAGQADDLSATKRLSQFCLNL